MKIKSLNNVMTQAWCKLAAFSRDEKGASGIEYVLIATIAAVAIALFVGTSGISSNVTDVLNDLSSAFSEVEASEGGGE